MKLVKQRFETRPVSTLKPHPQNPQLGKLHVINESVKENGFYGGVVVQKSTGYILVGNHRFTVAVAQGAAEIDCLVVDVDDETAVRIMLADNRTAKLGTYDDSALGNLLADLQGSNSLKGTGYSDRDVDRLLNDLGIINRTSKSSGSGDDVYAPAEPAEGDAPLLNVEPDPSGQAPIDMFEGDVAPATNEPPQAVFQFRVRCLTETAREVLLRRLQRDGVFCEAVKPKRAAKAKVKK